MTKVVSTLSELRDEIKTERVVVVYYTASWCAACKTIEYPGSVAEAIEGGAFVKVDMDLDAINGDEIADAYGVKAFPTIHVYSNGTLIHVARGKNVVKETVHALASRT